MVTTPQRRPFRGRDPSTIADLKLYWQPRRADHLLTATAEGEAKAQAEGYVFVRIVGAVCLNEEEGTVALEQYYHSEWEDHALLSSPEGVQSALRAGYKLVRREGWLFPFRNSVPGSVPLTTYWSEQRRDTVGVADSGTAVEVVEAKSYNLRRIEGRILPPTSTLLKSPSPVRSSARQGNKEAVADQRLPPAALPGKASPPLQSTSAPPAADAQKGDASPLQQVAPPQMPDLQPGESTKVAEQTSMAQAAEKPMAQVVGNSTDLTPVRPGSVSPTPSPEPEESPRARVKKEKPPKRDLNKEEALKELQQMEPSKKQHWNRAAKSIQTKFRGHQTRKRFLQVQEMIKASMLSIKEKQRVERKLADVTASLESLNETLATLGADVKEMSEVKSVMKVAVESYHKLGHDQLARREGERKICAKLKGLALLARDDDNEAEVGWLRRMLRKSKGVWELLKELVGFFMESPMESSMESQQDAWMSVDIFRACWKGDKEEVKNILAKNPQQIYKRDTSGATILCMCLLLNGKGQREIARYLLKHHPHIAKEPYTDELFKGELALHFPIVKRDRQMVLEVLAAYPEGLNARATGAFFGQEGACYFGEYPLFFAVCTNQPDLVFLLLEKGKELLGQTPQEMLDLRDTDENTVLHLCVWHNLPDMYVLIEKMCQECEPEFYRSGQLQACYNKDGFTPFTLAAKRGAMEVFIHLLERNTQETWQYGPYSRRAVFIDEIEPADTTNTERPTVLKLLVEEEHKELLNLELIREFLEVKWVKCLKGIFLRRLMLTAVYTLAFCCYVVMPSPETTSCDDEFEVIGSYFAWLKPLYESPHLLTFPDFPSFNVSAEVISAMSDFAWPFAAAVGNLAWCEVGVRLASVASIIQATATLFVITGVFYKGTKELGEISSEGVAGYFGVKGSMLLENILSGSYCLAMTLGAIASMFDCVQIKTLSLTVAALALSFYHLLLMLAFKTTGPFLIMMVKMITSDMAKFMAIFVVFLAGFAQAFHTVFDRDGGGWMDFLTQLRVGFEVLLGQIDLNDSLDDNKTSVPLFAYFLQISYVVMVTILMLNLLIALMSTTYASVEAESDVVWNLERSRLCLSLENEDPAERSAPGNRYWTEVEGRRCYMLPPLREDGMRRYFTDYKPDWASVQDQAPKGWVAPKPKLVPSSPRSPSS